MNRVEVKNGYIKASLDIFSYKEDNVRIVYSPALDLSGYGNTVEEAKRSFEIALKEYLRYCIENNTLGADLEKHGWKKIAAEPDYQSPDIVSLIRSNSNLRTLIKGNYHKMSKSLSVPYSC
jgi:hypothetical protein